MARPRKLTDAERIQRKREAGQRYYAKNREKILAYQHAIVMRHNELTRQSYWRRHDRELARGRAYREMHRDEINAKHREQYHANPVKRRQIRRREHYVSRYGITPEYKAALLTAQENLCAICHSARPGKSGWHIDHDHVTNEVRGILCHCCNVGLGHFRDDPKRLQAAVEYLASPPSRRIAVNEPVRLRLVENK